MMRSQSLRLPKHWKPSIRSAVLHAISLAYHVVMHARGQTARGRNARTERLEAEIALLREELRIKDARLERVPAHRRPHYTPWERLAILEVRAARGWSLEQTACAFQVTSQTIADWLGRIDEQGIRTIVTLREPVNKFPDFVGYLVQRLKVLCPAMGKRKLAEMLARAGLHLSATTIARMLHPPLPSTLAPAPQPAKPQLIHAKHPNHTWHVDLTVVPISGGFWCPWLPCALPQRWPFCWWMAVVVDHYSRRVMGSATFQKQPSSEAVRAFLGRTIHTAGATPKHLICDRGPQFDCHGFRRWCRRRGIQVRYGAVGKQGSLAVVERLIRTLKDCLRQLVLVPMRRESFRCELSLVVDWYNESRPHSTLGGKTPNEVYHRRFPACRRPRYEPRDQWPRGSPCAGSWALTRGRPGAELELHIDFVAGRKHLPVVTLKRVA